MTEQYNKPEITKKDLKKVTFAISLVSNGGGITKVCKI